MDHHRSHNSWGSTNSLSREDLRVNIPEDRARRSLPQHQEASPLILEAGRHRGAQDTWIAPNSEDTSTVRLDGPVPSSHKYVDVDVSEKIGNDAAMPIPREIAFTATIVLAQFLSLAALAQGIAPQEDIARGLRVTDLRDQAWFSAPYSLTAGTFVLMCGRLGDIWGHKLLLSSGYAVLGLSSCFAGFGAYIQRQEFFEVCRAFQGIGVAMMIPLSLIHI